MTFVQMNFKVVQIFPFQADLTRLRNQYVKGDAETKKKLEDIYGKKKLRAFLNDEESQKWMRSNCEKCPRCRTFIEVSKVEIYVADIDYSL